MGAKVVAKLYRDGWINIKNGWLSSRMKGGYWIDNKKKLCGSVGVSLTSPDLSNWFWITLPSRYACTTTSVHSRLSKKPASLE
jgi:hypothetical protein